MGFPRDSSCLPAAHAAGVPFAGEAEGLRRSSHASEVIYHHGGEFQPGQSDPSTVNPGVCSRGGQAKKQKGLFLDLKISILQ